MYKTIEALIPTMNLKQEDLYNLLETWNIQTDCIISNQCGFCSSKEFQFKNHRIRLFNIDSKGVSVNRNNLLKHLEADVGIFIDDDCKFLDGYEKNILDEMNRFSADAGLFTGYNDSGNLLNNRKNAIVCKKYSQISHIGGPGICVTREMLKSKPIAFNEKLGTPNPIYLGEDSFFGYQLITSKRKTIHSNIPVFVILEDVDNSSYFKGFDEQFFYSRGAINKLVHPRTFIIWRAYYSFKLSLKTKTSLSFIVKNMRRGEKTIKKSEIIY